MSSSTMERPEVIKASDIRPSDFLAQGYVAYAEAARGDALLTEQSALQALGRKVTRRIDEATALFAPTSPEGLYITRGFEAAFSFAMGLHRVQRHLMEKRKEAETRRAERKTAKILVLTRQGLLRGGVNLVLICGLALAATWLIFGSVPESPNRPVFWWSIFATCAGALWGIAWQVYEMDRNYRLIDGAYYREIARAKKDQTLELEAEMNTALSIVKAARKELTGKEGEEDTAFELCLRAQNRLYGSAVEDEPELGKSILGGAITLLSVYRERRRKDQESVNGQK